MVRVALSLNFGPKYRLVLLALLSLLPALWQVITLSLMIPVAQGLVASPRESQSAYIQTVLRWFNAAPADAGQVVAVVSVIASKMAESLFYFVYYSYQSSYMRDMLHGYRSMMFRSLLNFPMRYFNQERTGYLIQLLGDEIFRCRRNIVYLLESFRAGFTVVLFGVLLLFISLPLSAFLVLVGLLVFAFDYAFLGGIRNLSEQALESRLGISDTLQENLAGIRETKLLNLKRRLAQAFEKVSLASANVEQRYQFLLLLHAPAFQLMSVLTVGAMIAAYTSNMFGIRGIGVPGLLVFMVISHELLNNLMQFYNNWTSLNALVPAIPELQKLAKAMPSDMELSGSLEPDPLLREEIRFEDVCLEYADRGPILQGITFVVRRGERVAFVGESGSGKSTIIHLLVRLFDPTSGRILIDGVDVRDIDLEHLRFRIGLIPQDIFLFNATIRENIGLGLRNPSMEAIAAAARKAHAEAFIKELPDKYETVTGERGVRLSGGQKQRIAIAQVLAKDPEVIIFDEATSAVDVESEAKIQHEIEQIGQGKTILLVAHRLSTVRHADRIHVMSQGRIVETGSWDGLVAKQGYFSRMIEAQMAAHTTHEK